MLAKHLIIVATLSGTLGLITSAQADSIRFSVSAAPATEDLNNSLGFAFYGAESNPNIANTDVGNVGSFTNLMPVTVDNGLGTPLNSIGNDSFTAITYTNGTPTPAETASTGYTYAGFDTGSSLSLQTTLLASTETLSFYLTNFDAASDLTASVGGTSFEFDNLVLPTANGTNNDGTGTDFTSGVFHLTVTGHAGDVLTFTDAVDQSDVSEPFFGLVGIQAVTVDSDVPEPSSWVMLLGGLGLLVGYTRLRRSC